MVFCELRLRQPTDTQYITNDVKIEPTMDMPGTHFRNLIAPQTRVERVLAAAALVPTGANAVAAPTVAPSIYTFDGRFKISSRFDAFSYSWSSLTVLLIISSVIFMITLSTASNEIYGVSPTDKFAPSPKKFKDRVVCFAVFTSLLLSLLCGILIAHMITAEPPSWLRYVMIGLVVTGLVGVIAAAATPKTDDSDIRVFYTDRGLAEVSGSSGWVIRCMFLSLSLFIFCTPIIYWITSGWFLEKNKYISNMDEPNAQLNDATKQFYDENGINNPATSSTGTATLPFYGAGPQLNTTNSTPHPSVHQMRFGFLTFVTPRFVDKAKKNFIQMDTTVERPYTQTNAGAITMDVLIPLLCAVILFFLFKIYNIMSAIALIVSRIDSREKKDEFNRSHNGVLFFMVVLVFIIGLIIVMWLYSFLCWIKWKVQWNNFQKSIRAPSGVADRASYDDLYASAVQADNEERQPLLNDTRGAPAGGNSRGELLPSYQQTR